MARKTIITVIVLLAVLGLLFWLQQSRKDDETTDADLSVAVFNQTKNADATQVKANPKDTLVYTLNVQNNSDKVISGYVVETSIADISEIATLVDVQGANYNAGNNSLMWTPLDVPANGSIQKQFTVRVKDTLPEGSDLVMTTNFGDQVDVTVGPAQVATNPGPTPAVTPPANGYKAPTSGPSLWFAIILALTFTAGVVLYRTARGIQA